MFVRTVNAVYAPDGVGTGAGGTGTGSVPAAGSKTPVEQGGTGEGNEENNGGGFDLNKVNIWEQPKPKESPQGNQNNGNGNGNQQQQIVDPMEGFKKYVGALDFSVNMSPEQIQNFITKGDHKGLSEAIQQTNRQVYERVMLDSSKMLNQSIDKAVETAVQKATGAFKVDKSLDFLNTSIPIAKNANVAPVAQAAYGSFLKAGKTQEEAVGLVRDFLGAMGKIKSEDLGLPRTPSNSPGSGRSFASGQQQDNEELVDWLSFAKS